jgi:hypothetical protein
MMFMKTKRILLLSLLVGAAALTSGCQHVNPWERGTLADPTMRSDINPLGATGGRGVGGGGCGCN